jgi:hypothetical protein
MLLGARPSRKTLGIGLDARVMVSLYNLDAYPDFRLTLSRLPRRLFIMPPPGTAP